MSIPGSGQCMPGDYNGSCWKVGFAFERRSLEFWTRVPGRRRLAGCLWTQRSGDSRERFGQEPSSLAPSHQAGEHQENTKWREERTRTNVWRERREDDQMKKSLNTENIYLIKGWNVEGKAEIDWSVLKLYLKCPPAEKNVKLSELMGKGDTEQF